ncbi:MAG: hypothetical protein NXI07_11925, partial [bacterium]|nr:hypothetical protein [bacterium]
MLAANSLQIQAQTEPQQAWAAAISYGRPRLAEVCCTADSVLGTEFNRLGGDVRRYSEWNGFDLTRRSSALQLLEELRQTRPLHVWFSPPCGPESPMQNANQRTDEQIFALTRKRHKVHRIQRHISMIIHNLTPDGDIETHVEQPRRCGSWRNNFRHLVADQGRYTAVVDGCMYGLKCPHTGVAHQKRWWINTSSGPLARQMERFCTRDHDHLPLEGTACTLSASYPR